MTVVLGIIGKESCIIASDSRRFKSVVVENKTAINKIVIESDNFNKTFVTSKNMIIGGCAGLMFFRGKNTTEHLTEILNNYEDQHRNLVDHIAEICVEFKNRLEEIDEDEVGRGYRKVDVLIATATNHQNEKYILYELTFDDNNDGITYKHFLKTISKKEEWTWSIVGDHKAVEAAQRSCQHYYGEKHIKRTKVRMGLVAKWSLQKAINKSSNYYDSEIQTCGGEINTTTL